MALPCVRNWSWRVLARTQVALLPAPGEVGFFNWNYSHMGRKHAEKYLSFISELKKKDLPEFEHRYEKLTFIADEWVKIEELQDALYYYEKAFELNKSEEYKQNIDKVLELIKIQNAKINAELKAQSEKEKTSKGLQTEESKSLKTNPPPAVKEKKPIVTPKKIILDPNEEKLFYMVDVPKKEMPHIPSPSWRRKDGDIKAIYMLNEKGKSRKDDYLVIAMDANIEALTVFNNELYMAHQSSSVEPYTDFEGDIIVKIINKEGQVVRIPIADRRNLTTTTLVSGEIDHPRNSIHAIQEFNNQLLDGGSYPWIFKALDSNGHAINRKFFNTGLIWIDDIAGLGSTLYYSGSLPAEICRLENNNGELEKRTILTRPDKYIHELEVLNNELYAAISNTASTKGQIQIIKAVNAAGQTVSQLIASRNSTIYALAVLNNELYDAGFYKKIIKTINTEGKVVNHTIRDLHETVYAMCVGKVNFQPQVKN